MERERERERHRERERRERGKGGVEGGGDEGTKKELKRITDLISFHCFW